MFNPLTRWDRPRLNGQHAPGQPKHQLIEVVAQFSSGKIKPLYFNLRNHHYEIKRINYFWQDHQGREKLYCFNVTDGANIFHIYFNNHSLCWRLAKIE